MVIKVIVSLEVIMLLIKRKFFFQNDFICPNGFKDTMTPLTKWRHNLNDKNDT